MTDKKYNARVARARSDVYAFLTEAFLQLPNEQFLEQITDEGTLKFLNHYKNMENTKVKTGITAILSYLDTLNRENWISASEELAVDRTGLIRPVKKGMPAAPYEGLYQKKEDANAVILKVKRFYKKAGILPASASQDSPDFFCTELDFMRQLCLMEAEDQAGGLETLEKEFLKEHIGSWISEYCNTAIALAKTDFYKGLLMFLDGFIDLEKQN